MSKNIQYIRVPSIENNSPASIDRTNGIVYLNESRLKEFTEKELEFILLHELGHYVHQTDSEEISDNHAFDQLLEKGDDLTAAISALKKTLPSGDARILNATQIQRAGAKMNFFSGNEDLSAGEAMEKMSLPKGKMNYAIDPMTVSAGVGGLTNILGSLFGSKADKQQFDLQKQNLNAQLQLGLNSNESNRQIALGQLQADIEKAEKRNNLVKIVVISISSLLIVGLAAFFIFKSRKNATV